MIQYNLSKIVSVIREFEAYLCFSNNDGYCMYDEVG